MIKLSKNHNGTIAEGFFFSLACIAVLGTMLYIKHYQNQVKKVEAFFSTVQKADVEFDSAINKIAELCPEFNERDTIRNDVVEIAKCLENRE
jgi:hypothetical protein